MTGLARDWHGPQGRWTQGAPLAVPLLRADTARAPRPEAMARPAPDNAAATAPFAGRHALVADDNEMNRMILRTFLQRLGFDVTLASDGCEAVAQWQPQHHLLCLDIQMPGQDGMQALAEIRGRVTAQGKPMPLALAVTVNSLSHQVAEYLSCGFDACLPKPFARAELEALLRNRWN